MKRYNNIFQLFDDFFNSNQIYGSANFQQFPQDGDSNFHKSTEELESENHSIVKETWVSVDGSQVYSRTTHKSKIGALPKNVDILRKQLKAAIDSEEYEKAAKIRDEIKKIENK